MLYSFSVVIEGIDLTSPGSPHSDALFDAGCDDALLGSSGGVQKATFDREAPSFSTARCLALSVRSRPRFPARASSE